MSAEHAMDRPARNISQSRPQTVSVSAPPKTVNQGQTKIKAQEMTEEDWKAKKSNNWIALLLAVFFVMVVVSILGFVIYDMASELFATGTVKQVETPNLKGKVYSDALLRQYEDDFTFAEPIWQPSDDYDANIILSQDPKFREGVSKGTTIKLTVSSGKETVTIPSMSGKNQRDAEVLLANLGLKIKKIENIEDDKVPEGEVIRTEPAVGKTAFKGQEVVVYISIGAEAKQVVMPQLVKQDIQTARSVLETEKLTIGDETRVRSDRPAGEVVGQSVKAGDHVAEYTKIDLEISQGEFYSALPPQGYGDDEDVEGEDEEGTQNDRDDE